MNHVPYASYPPRNISPAWVIEVSLGAGLYRHIKISCDTTLERFSDAICVAFGFANDRQHAFFLPGWTTNREQAYYRFSRLLTARVDSHTRYTCDYTLSDVLCVGMAFRYALDYRSGRIFACRVLRQEEGLPEPDGTRAPMDALFGDDSIPRRKGMLTAQMPVQGLFPVYDLGNGLVMQVVRWRGHAHSERAGL